MSSVTLAKLPRLFAQVAGLCVFLTGALVLVGWAVQIPSFQSVVPGWARMAAGSALAFVLAGLSLWYGATEATRITRPDHLDSRRPWRRSVLRGCGVAVAIIGLFKLSELLGGWSFGIERLWFQERPGFSAHAQMAPATAVNFVLLGCALVLAGERRFNAGFQILTLLGGVIGWLGFSHYLYGGEPF